MRESAPGVWKKRLYSRLLPPPADAGSCHVRNTVVSVLFSTVRPNGADGGTVCVCVGWVVDEHVC